MPDEDSSQAFDVPANGPFVGRQLGEIAADVPAGLPIALADVHSRLEALQGEMRSLVQQVQSHQQKEQILGAFLDEFAAALPLLHPSALPILWPIMQEFTSRCRAPS